jgi:hypothetical protein
VIVLQNRGRKGGGLRAKGIFPAHLGAARASVGLAPKSTGFFDLFFALTVHLQPKVENCNGNSGFLML